jgi:hypothetical protein
MALLSAGVAARLEFTGFAERALIGVHSLPVFRFIAAIAYGLAIAAIEALELPRPNR